MGFLNLPFLLSKRPTCLAGPRASARSHHSRTPVVTGYSGFLDVQIKLNGRMGI